jgi:hypothetical protein
MSDPIVSEEELIDWLCWMWAVDGQEFYPVEETAQECMNTVRDKYEDSMKLENVRGWEEGYHERAVEEATIRLHDLEQRGFDPVERAAREQREVMKRSDGEYIGLDWTWYYGERDEE